MLDGRNLVLPRRTQLSEPDVQALMEQVRITLPAQPPPRDQVLAAAGPSSRSVHSA